MLHPADDDGSSPGADPRRAARRLLALVHAEAVSR